MTLFKKLPYTTIEYIEWLYDYRKIIYETGSNMTDLEFSNIMFLKQQIKESLCLN